MPPVNVPSGTAEALLTAYIINSHNTSRFPQFRYRRCPITLVQQNQMVMHMLSGGRNELQHRENKLCATSFAQQGC